MASESISSSISAAQMSAEITMTTDIKTNSKDASPVGTSGFASALLMSLSNATSDANSPSQLITLGTAILNSTDLVSGNGHESLRFSALVDAQTAGAKKSLTLPIESSSEQWDVLPSDDLSTVPAVANSDIEAATKPNLQSSVNGATILNSGSASESLLAPAQPLPIQNSGKQVDNPSPAELATVPGIESNTSEPTKPDLQSSSSDSTILNTSTESESLAQNASPLLTETSRKQPYEPSSDERTNVPVAKSDTSVPATPTQQTPVGKAAIVNVGGEGGDTTATEPDLPRISSNPVETSQKSAESGQLPQAVSVPAENSPAPRFISTATVTSQLVSSPASISDTDVQSEAPTTVTPLHVTGDLAGRFSKSVNAAPNLGIQTPAAPKAKTSVQQADVRSSDNRVCDAASATCTANTATNPVLPAPIAKSFGPDSRREGEGGESSGYESQLAALSTDSVQTVTDSTKDPSAAQNVLIPIDDAVVPPTFPSTVDSASALNSQPSVSPATAEYENVPVKSGGQSAVSTDDSQAAPANQLHTHPAIAETIPGRASSAQPLGQDINLVPGHDSPAPGTRRPVPHGTDAAGQLQRTAPNLAPIAGHFNQSNAVSKDVSKGNSIDEAAGTPKDASAQKQPSSQVEGTAPALSPTESTVGNKSALPEHLQSAEAAASLPITAISVASSTTVKMPNGSPLKADAPSVNKTTGVVEPSDSSKTMDLDSDTGGASASSEDSDKNGGKTSDDHTSSSATDRKGESSSSALSDTVIADPSKFDVAPAAVSIQGTATDASSMPLPKEALVSGNTPVAVAAPTLKDGNEVDAANPSNGDQQHQATSIQSAQLVSQVGKSDVTIALQGEQFGAVQLHAKVSGDQVTASITVEHHDTHALLSADLPALHQLLNERQLRVSEITLLHDALSSGGSSEDGSPAKREDTLLQHNNSGLSGNAKEDFVPSGTNPRNVPSGIFDSKGRLSVRA